LKDPPWDCEEEDPPDVPPNDDGPSPLPEPDQYDAITWSLCLFFFNIKEEEYEEAALFLAHVIKSRRRFFQQFFFDFWAREWFSLAFCILLSLLVGGGKKEDDDDDDDEEDEKEPPRSRKSAISLVSFSRLFSCLVSFVSCATNKQTNKQTRVNFYRESRTRVRPTQHSQKEDTRKEGEKKNKKVTGRC
jgi:hypothetical protein